MELLQSVHFLMQPVLFASICHEQNQPPMVATAQLASSHYSCSWSGHQECFSSSCQEREILVKYNILWSEMTLHI